MLSVRRDSNAPDAVPLVVDGGRVASATGATPLSSVPSVSPTFLPFLATVRVGLAGGGVGVLDELQTRIDVYHLQELLTRDVTGRYTDAILYSFGFFPQLRTD